MISTLQLGPLALPLAPLLLAGAGWVGLAIGKRVGADSRFEVERLLLRMLLLGLVAARLAFIWEWRGPYLHDPLSMLDIRDGGWEAAAGFSAACLYALSVLRRQPTLRKPLLSAMLVSLVVWTAGDVALAAWPGGASRERLPPLSLPAFDAGSVALTGFVGKPTVLNLWATWCPPCRREMPLLQQAQVEHAELHFVFVNLGETRADVVRYLQGQHMLLRNVLLDAGLATGAAFDQRALPTTLLFDAQGRLVSTHVGAFSEATLAQSLNALQAASPTVSPPGPNP